MSRFRILAARSCVVAVTILLAVAGTAGAQPGPDHYYQYSVLWVCGGTKQIGEQAIEGSWYRTLVNIHNPSGQLQTVFLRIRRALQSVTQVGDGVGDVWPIAPDQAITLACDDIRSRLAVEADGALFRTGFVTLDSSVELSVASMYTNNTDDPVHYDLIAWMGGGVHVEHHRPRVVYPTAAPPEPIEVQLATMTQVLKEVRDALVRPRRDPRER